MRVNSRWFLCRRHTGSVEGRSWPYLLRSIRLIVWLRFLADQRHRGSEMPIYLPPKIVNARELAINAPPLDLVLVVLHQLKLFWVVIAWNRAGREVKHH